MLWESFWIKPPTPMKRGRCPRWTEAGTAPEMLQTQVQFVLPVYIQNLKVGWVSRLGFYRSHRGSQRVVSTTHCFSYFSGSYCFRWQEKSCLENRQHKQCFKSLNTPACNNWPLLPYPTSSASQKSLPALPGRKSYTG